MLVLLRTEEENEMAKMIEIVKTSVRACRTLLKPFSLALKAVANVRFRGSDACGSESDDPASAVVPRQLTTYCCSDRAVFVEWGREHDMEIVTETARIVYSKRALPETYPVMVRSQN